VTGGSKCEEVKQGEEPLAVQEERKGQRRTSISRRTATAHLITVLLEIDFEGHDPLLEFKKSVPLVLIQTQSIPLTIKNQAIQQPLLLGIELDALLLGVLTSGEERLVNVNTGEGGEGVVLSLRREEENAEAERRGGISFGLCTDSTGSREAECSPAASCRNRLQHP